MNNSGVYAPFDLWRLSLCRFLVIVTVDRLFSAKSLQFLSSLFLLSIEGHLQWCCKLVFRPALDVDVGIEIQELLDEVRVVCHHSFMHRCIASERWHVQVSLAFCEGLQCSWLVVNHRDMDRCSASIALDVQV